jgi:glycosyltransferase involved in cell wall biosynthesis
VRVVYVSTLASGGPVSHLLELAPAVLSAGVDVLAICGTEAVAAALRAEQVPAVAAPLRHKLDLAGAARLWPELRSADVVHTQDRRAGLLARPQARARGAAAVHTMHGIPDEIFVEVGRGGARPNGASALRLAWLRHGVVGMEALLARVGDVVVPSQALADYLASHRFPRNRLHVIPNGVRIRRGVPAPLHSPLVVGTAAILEHRKGIDVLLHACSLVALPLRLEIYGEGSERARLEQLAGELGVDATFRGQVESVSEGLQELDVFVLPSRAENLPMAILEAMAAAVPVVATRVGGIPELVEDDVTGLLVEPDDARALAGAIGRIGGSQEVASRLATAGVRRIEEHFEAHVLAGKLVDLYERCASSR